MLKGRELKGLPVFDLIQKSEIGRVQDWLVDDNGEISALVIVTGGMWQRSYLLSKENISSISKKGVRVINKDNFSTLPKKTVTFSQKGWLGSKLLNTNGVDRGIITDILVDNNQIKGLEISSGLVGDLHAGRKYLSWQSVLLEQGSFIEAPPSLSDNNLENTVLQSGLE